MSVPYEILFCDCCDKKWKSSMLYGHFLYRLPDGQEANVERDWGWCNSCQEAVPVERLPKQEEIKEKLHKYEKDIEKAKKKIPTTRVGRWLLSFKSAWDQKHIYEGVQWRQERRNEIIAILQILLERSDLPKCLKCGSTEFIRLDLPDFSRRDYCENPPKIRTPYVHPDCGGSLFLTNSGSLRVAFRLKRRLYDGNGNALTEIPDRGLISPYGIGM